MANIPTVDPQESSEQGHQDHTMSFSFRSNGEPYETSVFLPGDKRLEEVMEKMREFATDVSRKAEIAMGSANGSEKEKTKIEKSIMEAFDRGNDGEKLRILHLIMDGSGASDDERIESVVRSDDALLPEEYHFRLSDEARASILRFANGQIEKALKNNGTDFQGLLFLLRFRAAYYPGNISDSYVYFETLRHHLLKNVNMALPAISRLLDEVGIVDDSIEFIKNRKDLARYFVTEAESICKVHESDEGYSFLLDAVWKIFRDTLEDPIQAEVWFGKSMEKAKTSQERTAYFYERSYFSATIQ